MDTSLDEISVRAMRLEREEDIHLEDPHLHAVCSLDGDTFEALVSAIHSSRIGAVNYVLSQSLNSSDGTYRP